ncbi:hypothetical protein G9A89_013211 [Geosiphon pyriformis]|nr:hypothetical protein G9A89_013211 [Geosiphon pyriformis]
MAKINHHLNNQQSGNQYRNPNSTNLSTTSISTSDSSAAATNYLSIPTNLNTNPEPLRSRVTQNWRLAMVVHQLIPSSLNPPSGLHTRNLDTSLTPENATSNNTESNQHIPTNTILPATISSNEFLAAIFPFKLEENTPIPLFSRAALEKKLITAMYTDARVDVDRAASARIITADGATKTPIGEIDDFPFEVNGIMTPIKVLVIKATQYQALVGNDWLFKVNATLDWNTQELQLMYQGQHIYDNNKKKGKQKEELTWETDDLTWTDNDESKLTSSWEWEENKENKGKEKEKEKETTQTTTAYNTYTIPQQSTYCRPKLICVNCDKKLLSMGACCGDDKEYSMATRFYCCPCILEHFGRLKQVGKWDNQPCLACEETLLDKGMWHNISGRGGICPHNDDKIWQMAFAKIEGATPEEIKTIKDNPPEPLELDWDAEPIINLLDPEQFHEHYQELVPTREEQEQWLEQLNTRLCQHCLILCDFQYCDKCDLIYNPPPHMIYMILEEEEPISSCASESELPINYTNSNLNYEQYIALPNLSKEQELKWYSDNGEGIMPERVHNTDAGFDLRYPGKDAIKLKPHSHTYIDLRIVLEILATTMVQLASRSSLAKRGINIRGGIIDAGYVGNIITMLQNDSEKTYVIEPNEKIAQAIFLPLVRIAQLVSVGKREELGITVRGIQGFRSTGRIDVLINIAEEEIVGQEEIISTGQAISIPPYSQYMLAIERKEKEQEQIFEAEATLCELGEIGLINLHIPAKSYSSIKILIYNNTGNVISIPEGTTIGYLTTEIEDQPPNPIPDFPQLCGYVDITSQTIYRQDECYLLQPEQLEQMNMGNLDSLQCMQLKMLLINFNNIFASKNEFGRTDIIQH